MTTETPKRPVAGDLYRREKCFTQEEFDLFAQISGDNNPIHVDPDFSSRTAFGRTVAHGMLLYSCLWGFLQDQFPKARQISQNLMFPAPTFCGDRLWLEVKVLDCPQKGRCELAVAVKRQDSCEATLTGQTLIEWDPAALGEPS